MISLVKEAPSLNLQTPQKVTLWLWLKTNFREFSFRDCLKKRVGQVDDVRS